MGEREFRTRDRRKTLFAISCGALYYRLSTFAMTTVSELSTRVGGRLFGNASVVIQRVASLESAAEGEIAYVEDKKFFAAAETSRPRA
jgi:hypothetical protein